MDSLYRDLTRLDTIRQLHIGQENLSPFVYFKDFVRYYFTRFTGNLSTVFKDFRVSEIKDYHQRHKDKLQLLLTRSSIYLEGLVVPIPKGMVNSYLYTLKSLLLLLDELQALTLKNDVQDLLLAVESGKVKNLPSTVYTKQSFDEAKTKIGKLFGKTGLTHSTAPYALISLSDIKTVDDQLLIVTTMYPQIIMIQSFIKIIESKYNLISLSDKDKDILSTYLMTTAYRLSIFAVIMDHIQDIEHGFVKSLDIILTKIPTK